MQDNRIDQPDDNEKDQPGIMSPPMNAMYLLSPEKGAEYRERKYGESQTDAPVIEFI